MASYLPTLNDASSVNLEQLIEEVPRAGVPPAVAPSSSGSSRENGSPQLAESAEPQQGIAVPAAMPVETLPTMSNATKKCRKRRARKKAAGEKETSGFEVHPPPVNPFLKRPRRTQRPNVQVSDYVVGNVMTTMDVPIPTTYKQARARAQWPQWRVDIRLS
jgi:hypothetical protein